MEETQSDGQRRFDEWMYFVMPALFQVKSAIYHIQLISLTMEEI